MTPASKAFTEDAALLKERLASLPTFWEGKKSVLELQEAKYNYGQMEWWAFYFELLCFKALDGEFTHPGDKFEKTAFDIKRNVNWDLKAKAIKSDSHTAILNDNRAMRGAIEKHGELGVVVALCDVEYNDINRTFEQWHTELKGGKSAYQKDRELRTNVSRYRKTQATLTEVLILRFTEEDLPKLGQMKQGRNSNAKPRPHFKYTLNLEKISNFLVDQIVFSAQ